MLTGFGVVTVQDETRQYFIQLQNAEKQKIKLNQDFAKLKLEQARLANHKLIKVAAEKQHLQPPSSSNTVIVERRFNK